jgi:hypothetical protein
MFFGIETIKKLLNFFDSETNDVCIAIVHFKIFNTLASYEFKTLNYNY